MFPLLLDIETHAVVLSGRGPSFLRRLALLDSAGASNVRVFSDDVDSALAATIGARLTQGLAGESDLKDVKLLFLTGLTESEGAPLAQAARALGLLVNSEDQPSLCDFHVPAMLRRGDLLLTVSTNGAVPGLASRLREDLAERFGPEWAARVDALRVERAKLRALGTKPADVRRKLDDIVGTNRWLL